MKGIKSKIRGTRFRSLGLALCCIGATAPGLWAQNLRLYVDDSGGNDIAVVDLAAHKKIDDIIVGERPHGLAVQADGRRIFTTIESDNTLRIIDTATDRVVATVALTGRPNQCAVTPDGKYVVVPIYNGNSADIVDVTQRKVVQVLPVKLPHNAVDAGSDRFVFVSSMGANEVNLIDLDKMEYAAHIPVGGVPRPYVVSGDGRTMYVALSYLHGFAIVSVPERKVIRKVQMPAKQAHPTFSPDGKYVVVSNAGTDDVSVIEAQARQEVARVKTGKIPKRVVIATVPRESASSTK